MRTRILQTLLLIAIVSTTAFAQEAAIEAEKKAGKKPIVAEERFVDTQHSIRIDGEEVRYTATPGQIVLRHADGKPRANVFFDRVFRISLGLYLDPGDVWE